MTTAKDFAGLTDLVGSWTGQAEMQQIIEAIETRPPREHKMILPPSPALKSLPIAIDDTKEFKTPENTQNPEPPSSGAPFLPNDFGRIVPALPAASLTPSPVGFSVI